MTKKILILTGMVGITAALIGCGASGNNPGRAYMPDMQYSRAYETYSPTNERLQNSEAEDHPVYSRFPVPGTIARGDMAEYKLSNDSAGYELSSGVRNPLDTSSVDMKRAERLYLVNCAICHGTKLDGMGPLYKGGEGPYTAAPKNLMADDAKKFADGKIFHVLTYGKGQMGSYASQLTVKERWEVVSYIKKKQGGGASAATSDSTAAGGTTTANAGTMSGVMGTATDTAAKK